MPALQAAKQAVGFWQEVVAVVVSARWRVVRSLLGLDPKLPLLWSTDLGNVGEKGWLHDALRCAAMRCDAKCDAVAGDKGVSRCSLLCGCVLCLRRAKVKKGWK